MRISRRRPQARGPPCPSAGYADHQQGGAYGQAYAQQEAYAQQDVYAQQEAYVQQEVYAQVLAVEEGCDRPSANRAR